MSISKEAKLETIADLQELHETAIGLKAVIIDTGTDEDYKKIKASNRKLSIAINRLIADVALQWAEGAAELTKDVEQAALDAEKALDEVVKKKQFADKLVEAVGLVDKTIELALKLLPVII